MAWMKIHGVPCLSSNTFRNYSGGSSKGRFSRELQYPLMWAGIFCLFDTLKHGSWWVTRGEYLRNRVYSVWILQGTNYRRDIRVDLNNNYSQCFCWAWNIAFLSCIVTAEFTSGRLWCYICTKHVLIKHHCQWQYIKKQKTAYSNKSSICSNECVELVSFIQMERSVLSRHETRESSAWCTRMLSVWSLPGVEGPPWLMKSPGPCCMCCRGVPSWTPGRHLLPHRGSVAQTASRPSDQSHWRQSVQRIIGGMPVKLEAYYEKTSNSTGLQWKCFWYDISGESLNVMLLRLFNLTC